jgi:hypothetical protein
MSFRKPRWWRTRDGRFLVESRGTDEVDQTYARIFRDPTGQRVATGRQYQLHDANGAIVETLQARCWYDQEVAGQDEPVVVGDALHRWACEAMDGGRAEPIRDEVLLDGLEEIDAQDLPSTFCEICCMLPTSAEYRYLLTDRCPVPPEAERLVRIAAAPMFQYVERCPICGAYYRFHGEGRSNDDLEEERIEARWRSGPLEALVLLDGLDDAAAVAERARIEAGLGELVAGLEVALRSSAPEARERAARDLARHHVRRGAWADVEALLRDADAIVRAGAVDALARLQGGDAAPSSSVLRLVEAMLDQPGELGERALRVLDGLEGDPSLAPVLPALIDRLDSDHPRAGDWDLFVATHFRLIAQNVHRRTGRLPPRAAKLGKVTRDLLDRIPALVRHLVAPKTKSPTARLPGSSSRTDSAAAWVLRALALKSEKAVPVIRQALDASTGAADALRRLSGDPELRDKRQL